MKNLINAAILALFFANTCFADDENIEIEPEPVPEGISLEQAARQIIIKDGSIRVLGAQTVNIDGKDIHIIKVLTQNGHIRHYKIDAETGELIN